VLLPFVVPPLDLFAVMQRPEAQASAAAPDAARGPRTWQSTRPGEAEPTLKLRLAGVPEGRGGQVVATWNLGKGWRAATALQIRNSRYDDREIGNGASVQRSRACGIESTLATDPLLTWSLRLRTRAQRLASGYTLLAELTTAVRATRRLSFELAPRAWLTSGEHRYVGMGEMPGQYLFGAAKIADVSVGARSIYHLTPRLSVQTELRLSVASGSYDAFSSFEANPAGALPRIEAKQLARRAGAPATNPDFSRAAWDVSLLLRWDLAKGAFLFSYLRGQAATLPVWPTHLLDPNPGSQRRVPASDVWMLWFKHNWG
jgi:hypothetical protein